MNFKNDEGCYATTDTAQLSMAYIVSAAGQKVKRAASINTWVRLFYLIICCTYFRQRVHQYNYGLDVTSELLGIVDVPR